MKFRLLPLIIAFIWIEASCLQAENLITSFRGSFLPNPSATVSSNGSDPISPLTIFIENNGGNKFAYYALNLYFKSVPEREYIADGIYVQSSLPNKASFDDYTRMVLTVWPNEDPNVLKSAAKRIEAWIKQNPNTPLLLIQSLRRAKESPKPEFLAAVDPSAILNSRLISKSIPVYPVEAMRKRLSGKVELLITIDETGSVEIAQAISGHPLLIPAVMASVTQWKYSPLLINGEAFPYTGTVKCIFASRVQ
jgi:TonB family protein